MKNSVIFTPSDFLNKRTVNKNIVIEAKNNTLIFGNIKDEGYTKIDGAIIMVYETKYDKLICLKEELGFTITNKNGEFFILLEAKKNRNYIFEVYEPLICNK